jgi:uncharacterized protein (DUF1697 family)
MSSSTSYVALLRGINLGPRNRVAMTDLRRLVEELGGKDVRTYLQSGNVVFRSSTGAAQLGRRLQKSIGRTLGLDVTVLVKTGAQLAKICERNPFSAGGTDPKTLHVTFLAEAPARGRVRELSERRFAPDRFRIAGREVYLHCPNGYGRAKLSNDLFERALGVPATTRNWRTVTALAELAS